MTEGIGSLLTGSCSEKTSEPMYSLIQAQRAASASPCEPRLGIRVVQALVGHQPGETRTSPPQNALRWMREGSHQRSAIRAQITLLATAVPHA